MVRPGMHGLGVEHAIDQEVDGLAAADAVGAAVLLRDHRQPGLRVDVVGELLDDRLEPGHQPLATLLGLGITPVSMDTILPTYLWRFRRNGQFERLPA